MSSPEWSRFRLRVTTEADPGALARVLERFQNLNILPRRVVAELATTGALRIQIDVTGLSEDALSRIAAKLGQVPSVFDAYWHRE
jgi:(p)ppGpp synthase/HD superfamily hydrolase